MAHHALNDIKTQLLFKGKVFKLNNKHPFSTTLSTEWEDENLI